MTPLRSLIALEFAHIHASLERQAPADVGGGEWKLIRPAEVKQKKRRRK